MSRSSKLSGLFNKKYSHLTGKGYCAVLKKTCHFVAPKSLDYENENSFSNGMIFITMLAICVHATSANLFSTKLLTVHESVRLTTF